MDKKSVIGLILIGAILFGFSWYNKEQYDKQVAAQQEEMQRQALLDSLDRVHHPEKYLDEQVTLREVDQAALDSIALVAEAQRINSLGAALVAAEKGVEKLYTLENNVMKMTVSSKGGSVEQVELKDYRRYSKDGNGPLVKMWADGSEQFDMQFFVRRNYNYAQINTANYYFEGPEQSLFVAESSDQRLALRLPMTEQGGYVEFVYTMAPDDYMVDFDVNFVGMDAEVSGLTELTFDWKNTSLQNEKGYTNENNYTTISYLFPGEKKIDDLGIGVTKRGSAGVRKESVDTNVDWFAFKQQFFSSIFIAEDKFQNADLEFATYQPGSGMIKDFSAVAQVAAEPGQTSFDMGFYFGPNKYSTLKEYDLGLEKVVPLGGWAVRWVNRLIVIPVFDFLSKFIDNYGLIIILLTIFIKLLIFPLTYKSYLSTAKMRLLKPEMDAIAAKYPNQQDQQQMLKRNQATMDLYKRSGVSPMGGCLPMLIQFPVLIAMFRFLPASIELRGEKLLWAEDLSSYDSVLNLPFDIPWYGDHVSLFALVMAATLFFYTKMTYNQQNMGGQEALPGMKFMMLYMMPFMMLMWFNNYASGLCFYYFVSQLITMGQTYGIRYAVNEDKLRARMAENAKKPVEKSKWQKRLEEAQKQQQEMLRQQQKQRR